MKKRNRKLEPNALTDLADRADITTGEVWSSLLGNCTTKEMEQARTLIQKAQKLLNDLDGRLKEKIKILSGKPRTYTFDDLVVGETYSYKGSKGNDPYYPDLTLTNKRENDVMYEWFDCLTKNERKTVGSTKSFLEYINPR